jgi:hypothetical protein
MRLGDQRGIALVAVLWVVAILALVAAVFMREARTQIALTQNLAEEAKAEALAEAGVNRAVLVLLGLDESIPWRVDGTPFAFEYGGGIVQVSMRSRVLTNTLRNAIAHSFFPQNKRDFKRTGTVTYKGKDVFSLEGLRLFDEDTNEAISHLADRAFGKNRKRVY